MEAVPKKSVIHKKPAAAPPASQARALRAGKPHAVKKPHAIKPEPVVEAVAPVEEVKPVAVKVAHGKSFYAVGRRKTAVAQILLSQGTGQITINKLPFEGYFQTLDLRQIALQPLVQVGLDKQFNVKGKIHGGGIHAQAESLRHAIARALIIHDPKSRRTLKKLGFLIRDPRVKERKKPGLKRARRAPQFSKR